MTKLGKFGRAVPAVILSLVLGACQSTPPVTAPPSAPVAVATATVPPSPSPTAPPAVADLFATQAAKLESGTLTFEGTATIGLIQLGVTGESKFARASFKRTATTTIAGVDSLIEVVQIGGLRYAKTEGKPWLEVPNDASDAGGDVSLTLSGAATGTVTDTGTEQRGGQTVHKLLPAVSTDFDPAVVLASVTGAEGVEAAITFYVTEDGSPVAATLEATWSQTVDGAPVDASLSLDITFSRLGVDPQMTSPDPWKVHTSSRWRYSMAYPGNFVYERAKKYDYFDSPIYSNAYAHRVSAQGFGLNAWAKENLRALKDYFNTKTVTSEAITIGGAKGRLFTATGKNKDFPTKTTVFEVLVVKGNYVFFVGWFFAAGNEAADLVTFKEMIATFEFTP